jgi:ABC-type oligopeptide transport system substrate-binding subunit
MSKKTRIFLLLALLTGQMLTSFADRGIGNKKKSKVVLNIKTPANSNFNTALNYNLRNGLRSTGSLLNNPAPATRNSFNTIVTYAKGNSIYILPYKQKVLVADIRQGYTGTKLIIRPR